MCYSDGAALVAEEQNTLQRRLYQFILTDQKLGFKTNKTKTLTVFKDPLRWKYTTKLLSRCHPLVTLA